MFGRAPERTRMPRMPAPGQRRPEPARSRSRATKPLLIVGMVLTLVLGTVGTVVAVGYGRLSGNIAVVEGVQTAGSAATPDAPLNILVMGTDKRTGKGNRGYGFDNGRVGERSDTTILLHVAENRSMATAVSIPRDTWVVQPDCAAPDKGPQYRAKFNNAFQQGGAGCTTELVQRMTGLTINHVVVVDFASVKRIVNALGGVEVCLNRAVNDPDSKLRLPAGRNVVNGEEALAFVRARKTLGDGSDIGRIERQQEFLASVIRQATDTELLKNPVKLFGVLDAATSSLKVDKGLKSFDAMRGLAESLRSIDLSQIHFVTMPFTYRNDNANVSLDRQRAQPIWKALRADQPWPPVPKKNVPKKDMSKKKANSGQGAGAEAISANRAANRCSG